VSARPVVDDALRDSSIWDSVRPRSGDVIIASCYKSGTTLTQQIVKLLLHGPADLGHMAALSPWVESRLHSPGGAAVEALSSPRFLKTHLPFEALPDRSEWRYIALARDGRDVCVSLYEHCRALREERPRVPGRPPVDDGAADFPTFWREWLATGRPRWDYFSHVDSWWRARQLDNVLLLHYADFLTDKIAQAKRIADFIGVGWTSEIEALIGAGSSLAQMKQLERAGMVGGRRPKAVATFVNKGTNGRWRALLPPEEIERYLQLAEDRLEPACSAWLQSGGPLPEAAGGRR